MNKPIPCVGFELLYSPIDRGYMDNFAQSVHCMTNKFIFDVTVQLSIGQEVVILFSNNDRPTENLYAEVKNCIEINDEHYQVALETHPEARVKTDDPNIICLPVNKGPLLAQEIDLQCPACNNSSTFQFIANQDGDWEKGILPMYNCGSCGTTRAMIGLLK